MGLVGVMHAIAMNHVTLCVDDIVESIEFYESVLGLERTPSLQTDTAGAWFRVGSAQLHLTERDQSPPPVSHVAFTIDDFESLYDALVNREALDTDTFGSALFLLPEDEIQVYFRDPSGNLLEADAPNGSSLPDRITDHATTRPAPSTNYEPELPGGPTLFLE